MRKIEIDEDVYRYLVSHTREFGETASDVLRRLLGLTPGTGEGRTLEEPGGEGATSPAAEPPAPPPQESAPPSGKPDAPPPERAAPSQPPTAPPAEPATPAPKPPSPPQKPPDPPRKPASLSPPLVAEKGPEPEPDTADPKQALIAFLSSPTVADANATTRYLEILGYLARERPRDFEEILDMGGRTRRYFADSKREIEESGKSTNPREIPGSPYWAMTGVDTFQKRDILRQAMEKMKYDPDSIDRSVEAVK